MRRIGNRTPPHFPVAVIAVGQGGHYFRPMESSAVADVSGATIEQSYKARETEGVLDLLFYRRAGFKMAKHLAGRGWTPNQVTVCGAIVGIAAGHLYFYRALSINAAGMLLHVAANLLDNVDGQLARLTNQKGESGKVIDGIGDYVVFAGVYIHLSWRHVSSGGSPWVWLLAIAAAGCHAMQSGAAEFSRDAYARFACSRSTALQSAESLHRTAGVFPRLHAGYTAMQERALPALAGLRDRALAAFPAVVPDWFASAYRVAHEGVARRARLLGTSTRMLTLFVALILRRPLVYFVVEVTILNVVFAWLVWRETAASARLTQLLNERGTD